MQLHTFTHVTSYKQMDTGNGGTSAKGRYVIGNAKTNLPIPHMEMRNPLQDGIGMCGEMYIRP